LREVIASLDGYEIAAGAWERHVLAARIDRYEPSMLDMICLSGEAAWARLSPMARGAGSVPALVPATPIALFLREHASAWRVLRVAGDDPSLIDSAQTVLSQLRSRGACFFADLASACSLDADQLRHAIGALVACGLVTSDGFSGLRALVWAARGRPAHHDRRSSFAGRWTAVDAGPDGMAREDAIELQAWTLLRRYGVIFRKLLTRETNAAPWRELARVYRRLEARGEIRGGRFVSGMSGEQFALPDAIERLREVRRIGGRGELIAISAADPLNLTGIVTAGERVRTAARNRIVYRDGVPVAVREADITRYLGAVDASLTADVSRALKPRRMAALAAL
jgi:ATP-dependent Lhr-like helicase